MRDELAAMRALSAALESFPDDRARVRAIRWVIEAFNLKLDRLDGTEAPGPPTSSVAAAQPRLSDPALTMEGIDELFPGPQRRTPASAARATPHLVEAPRESPTAALQSEAESDMPGIDELFPGRQRRTLASVARPTTHLVDDPLESPPVAPQDAANSRGQGVKSMIDGFVADFQKLARDWQE
jgi:hypothetical protein